jgi:hypothetical protein
MTGQVLQHGRAQEVSVFDHFVLTRFNVKMPIYAHGDEAWLAERIELFERYCLPSFKAQTNKDFTWLLFADQDSPDWFRQRLETCVAGLAEVVYVDGFFTGETAAAAVHERARRSSVITTRVDNDDAIADDFIAVVQSQFRGQQLQLINLVNGAQYSRRHVYLRPYTRNPFISLVEQVGHDLPRTVFVRRHFELDTVAPVANIRTSHPMWLQVVHGDNVLTELVGLRTRRGKVVPYFACALDVDRDPVGHVVEVVGGGLRIVSRLAHRPRRLVDLAQTVLARHA